MKLTKAPVLVHSVAAGLPAGRGARGDRGPRLTIGVDGTVKDVGVLQSGGARFDEAAIERPRGGWCSSRPRSMGAWRR